VNIAFSTICEKFKGVRIFKQCWKIVKARKDLFETSFVDKVKASYESQKQDDFLEYYRLKMQKSPDFDVIKLLFSKCQNPPLDDLVTYTPPASPKIVVFVIKYFCTRYPQSLNYLLKNIKVFKEESDELLRALDFLKEKYELKDDITQVVLRQ